uniref:Uncharacterized protein n=1 Tax=Chromera velia CCMP2878 TaxID=1169474 RepID=A0A0G4IFY6_9ALVE|eukprot:Cvel_14079.t1-p1 / transcript=Cvel_14079.t1 / gene=Cvel_14079 / organism=Chromera_velia_CCMP2878 / gene_product=hypothetical protein / transcript_product=hypothetical protein / location=Cvel_scaffold988:52682-57242(-) / protein_length=705 / sequence_SO=supercontig / SO=protein_coding / is_pseudo=false
MRLCCCCRAQPEKRNKKSFSGVPEEDERLIDRNNTNKKEETVEDRGPVHTEKEKERPELPQQVSASSPPLPDSHLPGEDSFHIPPTVPEGEKSADDKKPSDQPPLSTLQKQEEQQEASKAGQLEGQKEKSNQEDEEKGKADLKEKRNEDGKATQPKAVQNGGLSPSAPLRPQRMSIVAPSAFSKKERSQRRQSIHALAQASAMAEEIANVQQKQQERDEAKEPDQQKKGKGTRRATALGTCTFPVDEEGAKELEKKTEKKKGGRRRTSMLDFLGFKGNRKKSIQQPDEEQEGRGKDSLPPTTPTPPAAIAIPLNRRARMSTVAVESHRVRRRVHGWLGDKRVSFRYAAAASPSPSPLVVDNQSRERGRGDRGGPLPPVPIAASPSVPQPNASSPFLSEPGESHGSLPPLPNPTSPSVNRAGGDSLEGKGGQQETGGDAHSLSVWTPGVSSKRNRPFGSKRKQQKDDEENQHTHTAETEEAMQFPLSPPRKEKGRARQRHSILWDSWEREKEVPPTHKDAQQSDPNAPPSFPKSIEVPPSEWNNESVEDSDSHTDTADAQENPDADDDTQKREDPIPLPPHTLTLPRPLLTCMRVVTGGSFATASFSLAVRRPASAVQIALEASAPFPLEVSGQTPGSMGPLENGLEPPKGFEGGMLPPLQTDVGECEGGDGWGGEGEQAGEYSSEEMNEEKLTEIQERQREEVDR